MTWMLFAQFESIFMLCLLMDSLTCEVQLSELSSWLIYDILIISLRHEEGRWKVILWPYILLHPTLPLITCLRRTNERCDIDQWTRNNILSCPIYKPLTTRRSALECRKQVLFFFRTDLHIKITQHIGHWHFSLSATTNLATKMENTHDIHKNHEKDNKQNDERECLRGNST